MTKPPKTCDMDLRLAVTAALLSAGTPRDAIRHEITLDSSSSDGRADMVVALDRALIGIELKSGKDTLARLPEQRERYGARFDKLVLVLDVLHEPADYAACWALGFDAVRTFDGGTLRESAVHFGASAPWEPETYRDSRRFGAGERMAPHAMLSMLWADEALRLSADLVQAGIIPASSGDQRYRVIPHAAEHASIGQLRPRIAAALRSRRLNRWEEAFWTNFDALTKEAA
ncbi:hypothetical protein Sp245p_26115 (plasmid) [Azospirillum baldaniorum]|uniref:Uncharacterized protein n=1 Tax=Azospirillum baldaniorum TaxID=1064539 RepID=A0A9P1NRA3_9PROT|nr:hypothetical protein [Azospirillum baldaniorum]AWJ93300.1 hypothetical protein Sp245p_26115 [Azospirillum baldaniorum]TWA77999.1 hypothetical protein FBZ85_106159 [Azospirillum brasilense]CCD02899.1 protein of unknown function [Azospirillum baldaniorum]